MIILTEDPSADKKQLIHLDGCLIGQSTHSKSSIREPWHVRLNVPCGENDFAYYHGHADTFERAMQNALESMALKSATLKHNADTLLGKLNTLNCLAGG